MRSEKTTWSRTSGSGFSARRHAENKKARRHAFRVSFVLALRRSSFSVLCPFPFFALLPSLVMFCPSSVVRPSSFVLSPALCPFPSFVFFRTFWFCGNAWQRGNALWQRGNAFLLSHALRPVASVATRLWFMLVVGFVGCFLSFVVCLLVVGGFGGYLCFVFLLGVCGSVWLGVVLLLVLFCWGVWGFVLFCVLLGVWMFNVLSSVL